MTMPNQRMQRTEDKQSASAFAKASAAAEAPADKSEDRDVRNVMTMKTKLLLFAVPAVLLAVVLGLLWTRGHSYELKNVAYSEASKEAAVRMFIPPEACEITAWIMPFRMNMVASFRIREEDFEAWAKTKSWNLEELENARLSNVSRVGDPNDAVDITSGLLYKWVYDAEHPGSTFRVYAYDRTSGTGYFTQLGD